jgi:ubiquinone/menaquinone biosynthesis C-methylase UbiE
VKRFFAEEAGEWMDRPGQPEEDLREDLKNLGRINRYFGGTAAVRDTARKILKGVPKGARVLWVDLATGLGDHPRALRQEAAKRGVELVVLALDFRDETLKVARNGGSEGIVWLRADIRQLPLQTGSCDAALCSLALHHFSDEDAVRVLKEMRRVSRGACACVDLRRGRIAQAAVWLLTAVWLRHPMTVHDARLSVRRAFAENELKGLAERAGWAQYRFSRLPFFRHRVMI